MKFPLFQIINYTLILVVIILFIIYIWDMFFGGGHKPAAWQNAKKQNRIPKQLQRLERNYPDKVRFFNWWFQIERLKKENVPGAFAELGVYKGDSVRIIHHMDPSRRFHLFDTFEGFTKTDLLKETGEASTYTTEHFADTNVYKVLKKINRNRNIVIHQGYFPHTTSGLEHESFALVNLDCDLYNPTKAGLDFFYPRLSPGGVILVHDYNPKWEGIIKAVDEFIMTIPDPYFILPDMEGTVVIIRTK